MRRHTGRRPRRTTVTASALVAAALTVLTAATGCGGMTMPAMDPDDGPGAQVDVATPALQDLRQDVGLEPCPTGDGEAGDRPDALPAMSLPCLGGGEDVDLSALRGPTVITVWAQWCTPCREELPIFQQLADTGAVDVLGVNYLDTQPEQALRLLGEKDVTFPSVADPGSRLKEVYPQLSGLPLLVMVDAEGSVAYFQFEQITSFAELEELVESRLDVEL